MDTAGAGVYYRLSCFDVKWNCNQIPWLWFLEFCAVHGSSCQFVMWSRIKIKAPVSLCQSAKELSGSMHLDVQC